MTALITRTQNGDEQGRSNGNKNEKNDKGRGEDKGKGSHTNWTPFSLLSLPLLSYFTGKKEEETELQLASIEEEEANPFLYTTPLNWWEVLKILVLSLTLLPLKLLLFIPFLATAYTLSRLSLFGLSPEDLNNPLPAWRSFLLRPIPYLSRAMLFIMGYFWIKTQGVRDYSAPIIVSNHVSYLDYFILSYLHNPSFLLEDNHYTSLPIFGVILRAMQCAGIENMTKRFQNKASGKQVVAFPERVMTNGTHIVNFSTSLFGVGEAVQPVVLKYPHRFFCPSTPVAGPSVAFSVLRLLTQFYNSVEVVYSPKQTPSAEDRKKPQKFADKVRHQMLHASGLFDTGYTMEDARLLAAAMSLHIPAAALDVEVSKIMEIDNLKYEDVEGLLKRFNAIDANHDGTLDIKEFSNFLGFPSPTPYTERLFALLDVNDSGNIDFAEFLIGMSIISDGIDDDQLISLAFKSIDFNNDGSLEIAEVANVLSAYSSFSSEELEMIFKKIDTNNDGHVTLAEFSEFVKKNPEYNFLQIARDTAAAKREARRKSEPLRKPVVSIHHNRMY